MLNSPYYVFKLYIVVKIIGTLFSLIYSRLQNPDVTLYNINRKNGEKYIYLQRWWVIPKNNYFNIYLHRFNSSDEDRANHDHPWWNISILINGAYNEHLPKYPEKWISEGNREEIVKKRYPFIPIYRAANVIHRIELIDDNRNENIDGPIQGKPIWTIFITGPKVKDWGFWCPQGFRNHKEFLNTDENAEGKGCD